jgi:hypothetical protein
MTSYFSVVQYVPDPITNERMNVGVLVFGDGQVRARFTSDWKRVEDFGSADAAEVRDAVRDVGRLTEEGVKAAAGRWLNSIQLTQPSASLRDPEVLLVDATGRYIGEEWEDGSGAQSLAYTGSSTANSNPTDLSVDEEDAAALRFQPPYVVHQLKFCATAVVSEPLTVFEGLRKDWGPTGGRAYVGRPKSSYDNKGEKTDPPSSMLFVVYADPGGNVFDWDWVAEDPENPNHPVDWRLRFRNEIVDRPSATLRHVRRVKAGKLDTAKACYSRRGDCMFYYFASSPSYAQRINEDLTVFNSLDSKTVTGFKLKNINRIVTAMFKDVKLRAGENNLVEADWILTQSVARQGSPALREYVEIQRRWGGKLPKVQVAGRAAKWNELAQPAVA